MISYKVRKEQTKSLNFWHFFKQIISFALYFRKVQIYIMSKTINLTKGFDIKLVGKADKSIEDYSSETYAVKPATDFKGIRPKICVEVGDEVKAGSPLVFNKDNEKVIIASPVSGEVVEVLRGNRRALDEVRVLADKKNTYEDFGNGDPSSMNRDEIIDKICKSGVFAGMMQRPFAIVANPDDKPKAIFVSCFDTFPLAADLNYAVEGEEKAFQTGLNALTKLTEGTVHLNINGKGETSSVFQNAEGVQVNKFFGKHPAGCIGIQIHHLDPINKGEVAWYLNPQDVITIGKLFLEGKYIPQRVIALTGQSVNKRQYYRTLAGACIDKLVENNVEEGNLRYITGNVLTGKQISEKGYLGYFDNQITVIPEGDEAEFMGWIMPSYARPSLSKTFPWAFMPGKEFKVNTNMHGEDRAYVVTGQYESVLPMNLYPLYLIKAIMANDVEKMEGLGIYEVAEEELAICEFVCTSKTPVQKIVREGLDFIYKETM